MLGPYKVAGDRLDLVCNETDHDSKTFGRNLVFERENPQLLYKTSLNETIFNNAMY